MNENGQAPLVIEYVVTVSSKLREVPVVCKRPSTQSHTVPNTKVCRYSFPGVETRTAPEPNITSQDVYNGVKITNLIRSRD